MCGPVSPESVGLPTSAQDLTTRESGQYLDVQVCALMEKVILCDIDSYFCSFGRIEIVDFQHDLSATSTQ